MTTVQDLIDVLMQYPSSTRVVLQERDGWSTGKFVVLSELFYAAEQSDAEDQLSRSDRPEEQP